MLNLDALPPLITIAEVLRLLPEGTETDMIPVQKPGASLSWRKSTRSGASACVEIARIADLVAMRDSKNPSGHVLSYSPQLWSDFLADARVGRFDLPQR